MKRFMLVSLMSCMLVGQVSCDWKANTKEFCKGALNSMARSGGSYCLFSFLFDQKTGIGAAGSSAFCSAWRGLSRLESATDTNTTIDNKKGWHAGGLVSGSLATYAIIWGLAKKGIIAPLSK